MSYNNLDNKSVNELLEIAYNTSNIEILDKLSLCANMNIRRATARNKNINAQIALRLQYDPVLNVCYIANNNPKCREKREFDEDILTPCIMCGKDEREVSCINCINKKV